MIEMKKKKAIESLNEMNDDCGGDYINYDSMTNEELEGEFCMSGLFSDHYPDGYENDFKIVD